MAKRIVIDGAPGSGKSTVIMGRSHADPQDVHYRCIKDLGFEVIPESILIVFNALRSEGKDPIENMDEAIERILKNEINRFNLVGNKGVTFFDRALPGYEPIAIRYGVTLSSDFFDSCKSLIYNSPIFLFQVVETYDISKPRAEGRKARVYTLQERFDRYKETKLCYERLGYNTVEVPVFSEDVQESIDNRINFIREYLDI